MNGLAYLAGLPQWKGQGGFSLDKMTAVLAELGNPQDSFRSIHVAGTNGKGSVSVSVAAILGAAGHKVGLTTSPHFVRQNERVVVDGLPIEDRQLDQLSTKIQQASAQLDIELSYFEAITAVAFLAFREVKVGWAVVEVGLGGRLDATNTIDRPECCAITSIDFDHQAILGDTLELIAGEKAGIIKPGVPVVCGPMLDGPKNVITAVAKKNNAKISHFGAEFSIEEVSERTWRYIGDPNNFEFENSLRGAHQVQNSSVALRVCELIGVNVPAMQAGVGDVYWPARLESVHFEGKELLLDSAHNPAGVRSLISFLDANKYQDLTLGFGAIRGKDWKFMVEELRPFVREWHVMTPSYADPIPSTEICDYLSGIGVKSQNFAEDYRGFLKNAAGLESQVLIAGSMYLIGIVRSFMDEPIGRLWKKGTAQ